MSSDTASSHTQSQEDITANVSPTDTHGPSRFESIAHRHSEHTLARSDTPRGSRPSAISTSADNYGTFVAKSRPRL